MKENKYTEEQESGCQVQATGSQHCRLGGRSEWKIEEGEGKYHGSRHLRASVNSQSETTHLIY